MTTRAINLKLTLDNGQFLASAAGAAAGAGRLSSAATGGANSAATAMTGLSNAASSVGVASERAARRSAVALAAKQAAAEIAARAARDMAAASAAASNTTRAAQAEASLAADRLRSAQATAAQASGMAALSQQERQVIPLRQAAEAAQRALTAAQRAEADALAQTLNAQRALNSARSAAPAATRGTSGASTTTATSAVSSGVSQSAASASRGIAADAAAAAQRLGLVERAASTAGDAAQKAGKQGADGMRATESAATRTRDAVAGVGSASGRLSFAEVARGAVVFSAIESAARSAAGAITAIPSMGMKFIADTEVAQLGMAGMLSSMTTVEGQATTFDQAMEISAGSIRRLQKAAAETAASSSDLIDTFKAISGAAMSSGMSLEQAEKFTIVGVNAVKSQGLKGTQLITELRDLAGGGTITAASSVASMLDIDDTSIAKAKASAEGLFGFLMRKMSGFDESSKRFGGTLTGSIDALQEKVTQAGAVAMQPVAAAVKDAVAQISAAMDDGSITGAMQSIGDGIATGVRAMSAGASVAREYSGAIGLIAMAYGAMKLGGMASAFAGVTSAKLADINASRLSVAQAALSADARTVEAQSSRAMLAALIAEQRAKVAALATEAAVTASKLRSAEATAAQLVGQARLNALEASVLPLRQQHAAQTAALATAQNGLATATNAASVAARGMGLVVGALGGPIGIAITAATLLAGAFMSARSEAEKLGKTKVTVERVGDKIARGENVDQRDAASVDAALAEAQDKRDAALARTRRKYSMSDRAPGILSSVSNVQEDKNALAAADADVAKWQKLADQVKYSQEQATKNPHVKSDTAIKAVQQMTQKAGSPEQLRSAAAAETEALDVATNNAVTLMRKEGKSVQEITKFQADSAAARQQISADLAKAIASKNAKPPGVAAAASAAATEDAQVEKASAELRLAKLKASAQDRVQALDAEQTSADQRHQLGLTGVAEYEAERVRIQRAKLGERLTLIDAEIKAEESRNPKDRSEKVQVQRRVVELNADRSAVQAEVKAVDSGASGAMAMRELERQRTIAAETAQVWQESNSALQQLRRDNSGAANALLADPADRLRAEVSAQVASITRSADELRDKLTLRIELTRGEAARTDDTDKRASLIGQAEQLERQRVSVNEQANTAIELANRGMVDRLKPGWQTMVEGWGDANKVMRDSSDRTMDLLVQGGEDAFVEFAKTGKLNIKGLADSMISELARAEYRKFIGAAASGGGSGGGASGVIGGLLSKMGQKEISGPMPQGGETPVKRVVEEFGSLSPILDKFKDGLAGGTGKLSDFIGGLGSSLSGLFSGGGASSGGGFGGVVSMITSLFAADGASFASGGVRQFADGGSFANQIVSKDTNFRYREGGREKLGLMGEAGPEAIMPLSGGGAQAIAADGRKIGNLPVQRGPGGRLSVVLSAMPQAPAAMPQAGRFASGGTFGVGGTLPPVMQAAASRQAQTSLSISAPVNVSIMDMSQVQNMINQTLNASRRELSAKLKQQLGVTI